MLTALLVLIRGRLVLNNTLGFVLFLKHNLSSMISSPAGCMSTKSFAGSEEEKLLILIC